MGHRSRRISAPWTRRISIAIGVGALLAVAGPELAAEPRQDENEQVAQVRNVLDNWVETRRILSKERKEWRLGKQLLEERIELVQREIDSLREKIDDAKKSITEADKKKVDLVEQNEKLKDAASSLAEAVTKLEARVLKILPRLPEQLQGLLKSASQQIPVDDAEKAEHSLSVRYQNVLHCMNQIDKFQQQISIYPDVRPLPNGQSAQVTVMYLGISQGYFVSNNGQAAGVGRSTAEGWEWQIVGSEEAKAIQLAIEVYKSEKPAAFVPLPVEIR